MSATEDNFVVPSGHGFATKADLRALAASIAAEIVQGQEPVIVRSTAPTAPGVLTARTGWSIVEQQFQRKGRTVHWYAVIKRTGAAITITAATGWIGAQDVADLDVAWRPPEWRPVPGGYGAHRALASGAITNTGILRFYTLAGSGNVATNDTIGCSGTYSL